MKRNRVCYVIYCGLIAFLTVGCVPSYWQSAFYMMKAEREYDKAYRLRVKKIPYEERRKLYREACNSFMTAYRFNPNTFTYQRIETAVAACHGAYHNEAKNFFILFSQEYAKTHPTEVDYGEAGVFVAE